LTKEAEIEGFRNGQFKQSSNTNENVLIRDGVMVIGPSLQDEAVINANTIINLTEQGICSSTIWSNCVTSTNTTNGITT